MRPESLDEIITQFATTKCLEDRLTVSRRLLNYISCSGLHSSKARLLSSERSILQDFWELLKPDCIQRRHGIDQSDTMYELHCVSLQILRHFNQKQFKFVNNIISFDNIHVICNLLLLDQKKTHSACCAKSFQVSWDKKMIEQARDTMCGKVFEALFDDLGGEIYDVELLKEDTGENVVDLLSKECCVDVNNLTVNFKSSSTFSEIVKVVHVVDPQFVWVQELSDEIQEIDQDLTEHLSSAANRANEKDVYVIVKTKRMSFRGQVKEWKNNSVVVFAVDFGWQCEVPTSHVFKAEDHLFEIPPLAKLCRIKNIIPPCKKTELQIHVLKLLHTVTSCEPFAGMLIKSQLEPVLCLMKTTKNAKILCNILLYFSQLCFYPKHRSLAGELMIKPTLECIKKWFFCTEVLSQGLEVLRNLLSSSEKNREMFIFSGGLEVAFNAYASYCKEDAVHSQVLHVLKFCLEDYEFESSSYQVYSIDNLIVSGNPSEDKTVFAHLSSMAQYNIEPSNTISFVENIMKPQELVVFAREVVSFLNSHEGGTIYIGVTYQGLVNGLLMNRSRKDDCRTKIDMVISKMVSDYKLTDLPNQLVDCSFLRVKNIHNRALPEDSKMYVVKVNVTPGRTLSRLRDGDTNVFFRRRNGCVVPISANELRQHVASIGTKVYSEADSTGTVACIKECEKLYPESPSNMRGTSEQEISPSSHEISDSVYDSFSNVQFQGPPPLIPIDQLNNFTNQP